MAASSSKKIQWVKDAADGSATVYTYDKRGWLTKAVRTGGDNPQTYSYQYDNRGNRLTANASEQYGAQNYTFNAANQLTSTGFEYDGNGNLIKDRSATFTYNAAQQMVKTERWTGNSYTYTYAGNTQQELVSQDTVRGTKSYVYGREDQHGNPVIEQVTLAGSTGYVEHDPVTGEALMLRTPTGMQSLYVYDGIGNPLALVTNGSYTATAYEYDPYGVPTLTEDSGGWGTPMNPYQFKGGLHDRNTNWIKFGHRWYSVEWGRFSQQDTLDAPLDPANANRYAFAANDPINNADPTGQITGECAWDATMTGVYGGLFIGSAIVGMAGALPSGGGSVAGGILGMTTSFAAMADKGEATGDSCKED